MSVSRIGAGSAPAGRLTYTVEEVADMLGISRGSAYAAARDGTIPAERIGRRLVVPRGRFLRWLAEGSPVTRAG